MCIQINFECCAFRAAGGLSVLKVVFTSAIENLCLHKHLYTDVYCIFFLNCRNLEMTKVSFGR